MNEVLVFPPIIGFALIIINIFLILTVLIFGLAKLQKTQSKISFQEKEHEQEPPIFEKGFEILQSSLLVFYNKAHFSSFANSITNTFIHITNADGGMLLLFDFCSKDLVLQSLSGYYPIETAIDTSTFSVQDNTKDIKSSASISLKNTIYEAIANNKQSLFIQNTKTDTKIFAKLKTDILTNSQEYTKLMEASSYIFIPIIIKDLNAGLMCLSKRLTSTPFSKNDFTFAEKLSQFSNMGLENVFAYEAMSEKNTILVAENIATELQKKMYCSNIPRIYNLEAESLFFDTRGICSDYFDTIIARKSRVCFVLADVIGRGLKSLIAIAMIRAMLRIILSTSQSASTLLEWLNRGLMFDNPVENFASVTMLDYNPHTSTVECANAGENYIFYYSADHKTWEQLCENNDPLGISKETTYSLVTKTLHKDDIIVLCSDGIFESTDEYGNHYTIERIKKIIEKNASFTCKSITQSLKHDIMEYAMDNKPKDDASLILFKKKDNDKGA